MNTQTAPSPTTTKEDEFKQIYFTIVQLLDLPDDDDPTGPSGSPGDPRDTHFDLGLDFNRVASTGSALLGDDDLRIQLAPFTDPTLNFDHCLAALHGIRAHLTTLSTENLQAVRDGVFRARRFTGITATLARTATTTVHKDIDDYRTHVRRIEQRTENIRRRTPVTVKQDDGQPVHPLASFWSVVWHLCVAHGLGGPAGEAMADEIMATPWGPTKSLVGLTDVLRTLCCMDLDERSETFADMDSARKYFYPVLT